MTSLLTHRGVRWTALGWATFIAENLVLSQNREHIINSLGDDNYHMIYNVLSTAACSSIAFGYFKFGKFGGPSFQPRSLLVHVLSFAIQAMGLVGLSQLIPALQIPVGVISQNKPSSQSSESSKAGKEKEIKLYVRCPMDFKQKHASADGLFGVERVTRYPALWAMGFVGLGTAISTGASSICIYRYYWVIFILFDTSFSLQCMRPMQSLSGFPSYSHLLAEPTKTIDFDVVTEETYRLKKTKSLAMYRSLRS
jgi:hypothetical protein